MDFRLVYEGPLKANGGPALKHEIREQLRPQLAELWSQFPLRESPEVQMERPRLEKRIGGISFVPLVCDQLRLVCSLDILFLRRGDLGALVQGGDIDNRLKTLFDALRIPTLGELHQVMPAQEIANPFYCLLEDDRLIYEVKVTADRLLRPSEPQRESHVMLVIHVKTRPTKITGANVLLG